MNKNKQKKALTLSQDGGVFEPLVRQALELGLEDAKEGRVATIQLKDL